MKRLKVIIVGAGLSALVLANRLAETTDITIITKGNLSNNNSIRAQGGIAAPIHSKEDWKQHVEDTLEAGAFYNNRKAVEILVREGKHYVEKLLEAGFVADRTLDGELDLGREGAHSARRIIHAGGDRTGKYLMAFYHHALKGKVKWVQHQLAVKSIVEAGVCKGLVTIDTSNQYHSYSADAVVLATGGYSALYDTTSNDETCTGDGISIAYRAGAKVTDLEFVQFHPTMLATKTEQTYLISEAVRGEGAKLIDQGERSIMTGIHKAKDLAPRDIVSRAIADEQMKGNDVYLDIRSIRHFKSKFPFITSVCEKHNISVKEGWIPIRPGAHFTMGGVVTNVNGETEVPRLYAIGEVACTHVHGANRLASNSLLEGIVFANRLADHLLVQSPISSFSYFQSDTRQRMETINHPHLKKLKKMMSHYVGITRQNISLAKMDTWLSHFHPLDWNLQRLTFEQIQMNHMLLVANLITQSAQKRTESRGAHFRIDFPYQKENWKKKIIHHQLQKEHREEGLGI